MDHRHLHRLSFSLSLRRIEPLPVSLESSCLVSILACPCGSRAVTVRLKEGSLISLPKSLLVPKLELLTVLPLLFLPSLTKSSISRYSVEVVVPLRATPSRAGAVLVLVTEGLGDDRSPRGKVSVLCLEVGISLELPLPFEEIDPFRSRDEDVPLEFNALAPFLITCGGSRKTFGLDRRGNSGDKTRSRLFDSACVVS